MKFTIQITETLKKEVTIEANSEKDALQIVDNNYRAAKKGYVLSGDNYYNTVFSVTDKEK